MDKFEKIVINTWGVDGQRWLQTLPNVIERLSLYWHLNHISPFPNLSYNYVVSAINENDEPVVLKISCDQDLISNEYDVLKYFNGHGAIKVLDINIEHNALLLERASPGHPLKQHHSIDINDTIASYATVVKTLASHIYANNHNTHISQWCNAIDRIQDQRIEQRFVDKACELKAYLLSSAEREYFCHGDLHLDNIIQHRDQWLAIDPKGIVGEMAFEAAAFDLISNDEMQDAATIPDKIIDRVTLLSNALNLDYDRLLSWIFLRVIISAQWFIEDNGDPSEKLALATHLYPLLESQYNKKNAYLTYEKISDCYDEHRSRDLFEKSYLDKVISLIKPQGTILDLGCGTGEPITTYFSEKGFCVTGVDGSSEQIKKAKVNLPKVKFMQEDMRSLQLNEKFDCIIAWHSIFHLPKSDQRLMFNSFENHIKPNGILLFTSGPEEGESWSDNGGEILYHASLAPEEYQSLLTKHHFRLICHKVNEPSLRGATVWMAQYQGTT